MRLNSLDPRKVVAAAGAGIGALPVALLLIAYLGFVKSALPAGAADGFAFVILAMAACAAAAGALIGWSCAAAIERPFQRFTEYLESGDSTLAAPCQDAPGALGEMARITEQRRLREIEREREIHDAAARQRAADEARRAQDEAFARAAQEAEGVVDSLASGLALQADGDLEFRLTHAFPTAYRKLKDDFNAAMEQLQKAMRTIAVGALGIRAGADEISQSSSDLSRRTEHQAATLEEAAAALDQITQTVRKNAESAKEVSGAVTGAMGDAQHSEIIVRDAIGAMSEISRSAQEISQIIGVIDEIAFQTNLLALNAGVEAARAGDAGRGFAVVATEVRALAQRSAAAAKEIKALISTSGKQVNSGVQLVGDAGASIGRIISKISDINVHMTEMASSAKEQASALREINSSIGQMDNVTQKNAAMVEENTAACFALAHEAQQLTDLIARFHIGAAVEAPQRPASAPRRERAPPPRASGAATARKITPHEESWEEF